jgi:hypothetical protein
MCWVMGFIHSVIGTGKSSWYLSSSGGSCSEGDSCPLSFCSHGRATGVEVRGLNSSLQCHPSRKLQLCKNRCSQGTSESINFKWRGWTCWSPWFFLAWHFCNSRGLPVTFWGRKPSNRKRMCLCIKNGQDRLGFAHGRCPYRRPELADGRN